MESTIEHIEPVKPRRDMTPSLWQAGNKKYQDALLEKVCVTRFASVSHRCLTAACL